MATAPRPALTVIVLTRDEARHIERCLDSVRAIATRMIVVDSGSRDDSCARAAAAGAEVVGHDWTNYARQFNWGLDHAGDNGGWTMRLDADEVVAPALAAAIAAFMASAEPACAGATVDRGMVFLGRRIRWGGMFPTRVIRLWRTGRGRVENRWMDEHVVVTGAIDHIDGEITDINLNSIGWWTAKHNGYATREAIDQLMRAEGLPLAERLPDAGAAGGLHDAGDTGDTGDMGPEARRKRWIKDNVYARLPLGLRPLLYFLYRYIVLLGILDGWQGLAFHGLQGFWYRFLVDAKIAELRRLMAARGQDLATVVATEYGYRIEGN